MCDIDRLINIARNKKPKDWDKKSFHVTIAFKKKQILSIGVNKYKTHPKNLNYNYISRLGNNRSHLVGIHSELDAVRKLKVIDCSNITFYVIRIDKFGNPNYSKPCSGCLDVFKDVGYKKIFYTNHEGNFNELKI